VSVTLTAPSKPGNYVLRERLVQEGVTWPGPILKTSVNVAADRTKALIAAAVPTIWNPGEVKTLTVKITNNSTGLWSRAGAQAVRLGVYLDGRSDAIGDWGTAPTMIRLPKDLEAGQSVLVKISVRAPADSGRYVLRLRMCEGTTGWFTPLTKRALTVQG
jgi:hypothetical protein